MEEIMPEARDVIPLLCFVLMVTIHGISSAEQGQGKMDTEGQLIGTVFPSLEAKTLSGTKIVYPDSVKGKVTLIVLAFERQTQDQVDSWLEPFAGRYGQEDSVQFYEVPMLAGRWRLISGIIDGGMRRGVPRERHDHVSTFYGNVDRYCKRLQIEDRSDGYVFLLDRDGRIQWRSRGWATEERLEELFEETRMLTKCK